jgi:serine/threonine protein kinase
VSAKSKLVCQVCGTALSGGSEACPVCALRGALGPETTSLLDLSSELRFEHYQVLKNKNGTPVELGRGAMGVTYRALDVNLRCAVALKVISARWVGDELARRRFVREARSAASVRHPNVASVFHLGTSGDSYFYAIEFVEGEPLDEIIRRSGRLEVKLALEIVTQVATGLGAVHKQNLVHRDIKPSNIMVNLEGDASTTVKIIDLGLAKAVTDSQSETAVSMPGSFVGTPAFASPEQFAGIGVDIRSDLYSLGVTLWNMLTGQPPFRGTSAELMHQHFHATLPIGQLERVPQPVVTLLEMLLDKEPAHRFQSPVELLKAISEIKSAIDVEDTITRDSLRMAPPDLRATPRQPPLRPGPENISVARLPVTGSDLFGREEDIAFLTHAWANQHINIVTIVAWAGVGKSTLVNHWLGRMAAEHYRSTELVFGWSFYRQGSSGGTSSADEFFDAALAWFGDSDPRIGTAWVRHSAAIRT